MFRRILVPIDGTEYSWRALEYACELVAYSGGSLVIMTVSTSNTQPVIQVDGDCLYAQIGDEVLDAAHIILNGKDIECTYLLENSTNIAESILHTIKEERCDGVVLGSRGMGVIEGLFRSSVSQVVVENASVPVTIIK